MKKIKKILIIITIALASILLVGCNNEKKDKFLVVSTTTMLNDAVKQLAGDKVEAVSLIKAGVDPHTYTLVSQDVKKLQNADLVIVSGLHLEAQMGQTISTLGDKVLDIGITLEEKHNNKDGVTLLGWEDQLHDPHFWFNIDYWKIAVNLITERLIKDDPNNKLEYERLNQKYLIELDEAKTYVENKIKLLEDSEKILMTAHDAFSYFGVYYNFRVTAIQGISTEQEASPEDIKRVAKEAQESNVKVIFIESSIPKRTVEAVVEAAMQNGYTLKISQKELLSDSLGVDEDNNTYIKMIKYNIDTIVDEIIGAR